MISAFLGVAITISLSACGSAEQPPPQTVFGGDRPVELLVPVGHDADTPAPLLIVLHGFGVTGLLELGYSRLDKLISREGLLVLAPDGTRDLEGNPFWNVESPSCQLELGGAPPNDVEYLIGLIDEVSAEWAIDPKRVYVFGHSNGAFMAHRLACDHASQIAAIVSLAGTRLFDELDCTPTEAVSILQLHGDADDTVLYGGGTEIQGIPCAYPSAKETVALWAPHGGCAATLEDSSIRLDLDSSIDGDETRVERHPSCSGSLAVELWTIEGGEHIPTFRNDVHLPIWDFLSSHPKP